MKPMRTFIAVNVSDETRTVAQRMIRRIDEANVGAKCVQTPNLHITLKFLGEVQVERTPEICSAVQKAAQSTLSFSLECGGLDAFPDRAHPRTVWMGVQSGHEALMQLQQRIDQETRQLGYQGESRQYHPHLTLARIRASLENVRPLQEVFQQFDPGPCRETWIDEVLIYGSFMQRGMPSYEVLGRSRLR